MKATIKYGIPPPGRIYYNLPVFEAHPKPYWNSFISYTIIKAKNKEDTQEFYYLSFIEISGEFNTVQLLPNLELTEAEIHIINESYFYILDHPDIKECEINLV